MSNPLVQEFCKAHTAALTPDLSPGAGVKMKAPGDL